MPKLRIHCEDLRHSGARAFFQNVDPSLCLEEAVNSVISVLYGGSSAAQLIPPTRSITLILKPANGVAETGGIDLDADHKEILFSLNYIEHAAKSRQADQVRHEIRGVLVHEMVHAWQWNGHGKAPGGLIEGIADFVRLKTGLGAHHWERKIPDHWDAGYDATAFFLDWLETTKGKGTVGRINVALKDEYRPSVFWKALFDQDIEDLFERYKKALADEAHE